MKSPTRALRLFLVLTWLMVFWARPVGAQAPPAEFSTNLTQGATTLGFHFAYHPIRNPNFTVQVQTSAGTLTVGAVPVEPAEPPTLSVTQTGDTLTLARPPAYTRFALYVQTNALAAGLGTNWLPVSGVVSNLVTVPVNRDVPAVFYQLREP